MNCIELNLESESNELIEFVPVIKILSCLIKKKSILAILVILVILAILIDCNEWNLKSESNELNWIRFDDQNRQLSNKGGKKEKTILIDWRLIHLSFD